MKIIGLDVGEKRIGVARVDSDTRIAVPVGYILADEKKWQEINRIARLNNTNFFVLGLPRSNEGNETKQTEYVRGFARELVTRMPDAKVRFQDESLTSVEAEQRLKMRKKKYEKGEIDAEAASIILQDFVESFAKNPHGQGSELSKEIMRQQSVPLAVTKKAADKIVLESKKVSHKLRNALIISPIVLIIVLLGVTAVLKYRDHVRAEREAEYRRQEAEMVAEVFNFTVRPGETIYDIKKELMNIGYSETEVDAGLAAQYDFEMLKDRPAGATLEGYLYGETHEFYKGAAVKEIIKTFLAGMEKVVRDYDLENKFAARGLTLYEGITLASVVQKEASPAEQPTVAQVFLKRLAMGMTLGSDVTVSYALDTVDPERLIYKDNAAALKIDSCYNTRLFAGLPCGPISNPGLTALMAVAEPSDTDYLYFLTGDDGLMYYSSTESEHSYNAATYCKVLCNVSL
ncbi:endolytic transglycosylase MltG [Candidatus Saccharibacteria bacterium]|nr:endolytic transglycosylase MltG [Candidatus Saccharibacteria bacterium]